MDMSNPPEPRTVNCKEPFTAEIITSGSSDVDKQKLAQAKTKKKNRKKHREGVSKASIVQTPESKSRTIPNSNRMRNNSSASVDQGYISASPCTTDLGVVSPPTHANRTTNTHQATYSRAGSKSCNNEKYFPSTSPFSKVHGSDVYIPSSNNHRTPSPLFSAHNKSSGFSTSSQPMHIKNEKIRNDIQNHLGHFMQFTKCNENMQALQSSRDLESEKGGFSMGYGTSPTMANQMTALYEAISADPAFSSEDAHSFSIENSRSSLFPYPLGGNEANALDLNFAWKQGAKKSHSVSLPLIEGQELNFGKVWRSGSNQQGKRVNEQTVPAHHTETRIVPMRSTTFAKRYDFSTFQNVLPRQNINPYHIKMEGEGYGSDDLRNMILSALSMANCSQMNCVLCGLDLPIYDHFPLIDGTMFLAPCAMKVVQKILSR